VTTLRQLAEKHKYDSSTFIFSNACKTLHITLSDIRDLIQDSDHKIRLLGRQTIIERQKDLRLMVAQQLECAPELSLLDDVEDFSTLCQDLMKTDLSPEHCRLALIQHLVASEANAQNLLTQLAVWYPNSPLPRDIIEAIADTFHSHLMAFANNPALLARLFDHHILRGKLQNDTQKSGLAIAAQCCCDQTIARIQQYDKDQLIVAFNRGGTLTSLPIALQKALCLRAIELFDDASLLQGKLNRLLPNCGANLCNHLIQIKNTFDLAGPYIDQIIYILEPTLSRKELIAIIHSDLLESHSPHKMESLDRFDAAAFIKEMSLTTYKQHKDITQGLTRTDKNHLEQDFAANTADLTAPYLQKILTYLKDSKLCAKDSSTFVQAMRLPVKGSYFTTRMTTFTQALEARISRASPPAPTSDSKLSTTASSASLASTSTQDGQLSNSIQTVQGQETAAAVF
jgi:hypothetical protein